MADSQAANKKPPVLLRTLSNHVGPDRNCFHHRDGTGLGLPKYHEPVKIRNSAIVPERRYDLSAVPHLQEERKPLASSAIDVDVVDQTVNGDDRDAEKGEGGTKPSCVTRAWTFYKLGFVSLSLLIACFDLGADWFAVKDFHENDGGPLAVALTVFISISTLLFLMEAVNGVTSIRVYGFGHGDRNAVEVRREALSYGLLLLEDLPVTIIMFYTLKESPCPLYRRIFNDSHIARYAMMAAFVSSLWKALISFKYFIQCLCGEKFIDNVTLPGTRPGTRRPSALSTQRSLSWDDRLFCWACVRCRPMRMVINIVVSIFAGYVFTRVWSNHPFDMRPECEFFGDNIADAQQGQSNIFTTVMTG